MIDYEALIYELHLAIDADPGISIYMKTRSLLKNSDKEAWKIIDIVCNLDPRIDYTCKNSIRDIIARNAILDIEALQENI